MMASDFPGRTIAQELREQLSAKDAEIAEARATIADMANTTIRLTRERDEARECAGRLYSAAIDVVAVADRATLIFDTMKAALSATPEHLRK